MTTGGFDPNQGQQQGQPHYAPMPGAPVAPAGPVPGELLPRLGARIIDGLIVGIPMAIVSLVITFATGAWLGGFIGGVATAAVMIGYFVYLETTKGQTLGKQLLKLRVVGPDGGLPTQQQSLIRNAFYGLSALASIPFIGWLFSVAGFALWVFIAITISNSPLKQGKHDELAGGTRVVQV